ncbi:hypothetical protein [Streptomyces sp. NBC_01012]|uniref:hypothetical protein n=1 Tax=Streptomyces sp. NBC_01012 TaxID=2903717 RepID=UPI003864A574|nr:hypothetical protein OG623_03820 [Streptomyces sp. NBC_01012]
MIVVGIDSHKKTHTLVAVDQVGKRLTQLTVDATAEWTDWYVHRRLHGEIGHIPPAEYEANHYKESTKPQVKTTI